MMKKLVLIVTLLVSVGIVYAAAPGPVDLKASWGLSDGKQAPVMFDHGIHGTKNKCTECHATDAGGKFKPEGTLTGNGDKNMAHKYCWDCHTTQGVKVGKTCTKCHVKAK